MNTLVAVAMPRAAPAMNCPPRSPRSCASFARAAFPNRTTSMFTEIEGDWDEVMQVVRDATFVLASKGIRTEVVLKADIRPGFTDTMTGKLERMEAQIKKQEKHDEHPRQP